MQPVRGSAALSHALCDFSNRWKALPLQLGRLRLEVRSLRRTHPSLSQAHRPPALPVPPLRQGVLQVRPPGFAHETAHVALETLTCEQWTLFNCSGAEALKTCSWYYVGRHRRSSDGSWGGFDTRRLSQSSPAENLTWLYQWTWPSRPGEQGLIYAASVKGKLHKTPYRLYRRSCKYVFFFSDSNCPVLSFTRQCLYGNCLKLTLEEIKWMLL